MHRGTPSIFANWTENDGFFFPVVPRRRYFFLLVSSFSIFFFSQTSVSSFQPIAVHCFFIWCASASFDASIYRIIDIHAHVLDLDISAITFPSFKPSLIIWLERPLVCRCLSFSHIHTLIPPRQLPGTYDNKVIHPLLLLYIPVKPSRQDIYIYIYYCFTILNPCSVLSLDSLSKFDLTIIASCTTHLH